MWRTFYQSESSLLLRFFSDESALPTATLKHQNTLFKSIFVFLLVSENKDIPHYGD